PISPACVGGLDLWADRGVATEILRHADADGLARDDHWAAGAALPPPRLTSPGGPPRLAGGGLDEEAITALFSPRGKDLARVVATADELRRVGSGDTVSYVVTRNI